MYIVQLSQSKKYRYNMTAKGPNIKLDANYKLVEYIENGIKKRKKITRNISCRTKKETRRIWSYSVCKNN